MHRVIFTNSTKQRVNQLNKIKELINFAVQKEKIDNIEFGIIFVDNDIIKEINKTYRHIDRPTDVITFALEDNEQTKDEYRLLGDIYISLDKAKEQALEYGHSYLRELSFLAIHGFLHLLGYDHLSQDEEKEMFDKQEEILNEFGIKR